MRLYDSARGFIIGRYVENLDTCVKIDDLLRRQCPREPDHTHYMKIPAPESNCRDYSCLVHADAFHRDTKDFDGRPVFNRITGLC